MSFCKLLCSPNSLGEGFFQQALAEAQKGLGFTHPNPPVGAVLVKNSQVIATGYHAKAGELHAEARALQMAGEHAHGATLYVTLEPCNHFGRTPPCTEAIIRAGVKKVIYGAADPDPTVKGHGNQTLQAAGIEVEQVSDRALQAAAESLIQPFATLKLKKRPYVLAKIATSLDGKIAFKPGEQTQITGLKSKILTHRLREAFDVIGVGAKTQEIDKPKLTARFDDRPAKRQPAQVVFRSSESLADSLAKLGDRGFTSLLLEGGGQVLTAFLKAGLVDEIAWFTAPKLIGQQGVSAILDLDDLKDYSKESWSLQLGVDFLTILCQNTVHGEPD